MSANSPHQSRRFRPLLMLLGFFVASPVAAGTLQIQVVDPDGEPVPEVAVFVEQESVSVSKSVASESAIMDQRDIRFVPHILVVQTGTKVEFPNSDTVAHHVYSFSKPNGFVLPLYKGATPDPVVFDIDGVVTLGCNIHDNMLGYIVVVDTDVFAVTDQDGNASLGVDDSATGYKVSIWSARIRDSRDPISQTISGGEHAGKLTFSLQESLRPRHEDSTDSIEWSEY